MSNQKVKIVILFLLIIITIVGGYILYRRLEINKQSSDVNIYDYLPPSSAEVVNLNKSYDIDDIYLLYPSVKDLIALLGDNYSFPLVVSIFETQKILLVTKVTTQEFASIQKHIANDILSSFQVKNFKYKDVDIFLYSLPEDGFITCTFKKGIFAVSKNIKLIEDFIDTDPQNTFFSELYSNQYLKERINKILASATVQLFKKTNNQLIVLDYSVNRDSILLDGFYAKLNTKTPLDSVDSNLLPDKFSFTDSLCVDSCYISNDSIFPRLKIFLNKKF